MKLIVILIFALASIESHAQELKNTVWIKIFATKSDGSEITEDNGRDKYIHNFYFKENTVVTMLGNIYASERPFSIKGNILSIGSVLKYRIDTVNNIVLKLTEVNQGTFRDVELYTYSFINSRYAFEYFKEKHELNFLDSSVIDCNRQFSPVYIKDDLLGLLAGPFRREDSITMTGYFLVNPDHSISNVRLLASSKYISEKQMKKFTMALGRSGNGWILPETGNRYSFKVKFNGSFGYKYLYFQGQFHKMNYASFKINEAD